MKKEAAINDPNRAFQNKKRAEIEKTPAAAKYIIECPQCSFTIAVTLIEGTLDERVIECPSCLAAVSGSLWTVQYPSPTLTLDESEACLRAYRREQKLIKEHVKRIQTEYSYGI